MAASAVARVFSRALRAPATASRLAVAARPLLSVAATSRRMSSMPQYEDGEGGAPLPLEEALKNEIDFEENSEDASALLSDEFAKEVAEQFHGFKVNLNAGKTTILLRRKVKDMHVEVELEACNTEVLGEREPEADAEGAGAEDEPEDNNVYAYTASVTVDREGSDSRVIFLVVVPLEEEAGVEINTVYNVPKGMTIDQADKEGRYTPPSFSELDVGVQSSFHLFLAELGIDDKFADAVRVVADRKEQSEYIKWLKSLHSFVGGKMISA